MPVTDAVHPCRSTTSARPPVRASTGAATARSRSSDRTCRSRSRASASFATESTHASVAGCIVSSGPLTSTTPISRPSRGSVIGAPAHVQVACSRTKCSEANTCTGHPVTAGVPTPLVPTASSRQSAPTSKPRPSALRRTGALPSRHSTRPSSSATTMMWCVTSATDSSPSRSTGSTCRSVEVSRRRRTSSAESSSLRKPWSGSTPLRSIRSHDWPITGRGATGARPPDSAAVRTSSSTRAARAVSTTARCVTSIGESATGPPEESCGIHTAVCLRCPRSVPGREQEVATPCNSGGQASHWLKLE